jgi:hypothetical protein
LKNASNAPTEIIPPVLLRLRNAFQAPRFQYLAIAVVLGIVVSLAYLPGLAGPFVLDDLPNIVENPALKLRSLDAVGLHAAMSSGFSGPLGRPLAMASFALNTVLAGGDLDPFWFKVTNVAIHCINGILAFTLFRLLQRQIFAPTGAHDLAVPVVAAAIWALHPIQLTSVLYVVQRMNSLSALFVLAGLIIFVKGRQRLAESTAPALALMTLGLAAGLILGGLAKENAVLIVLYAWVIEFALFTRNELTPSARRMLRAFYLTTAALPVIVAISASVVDPAVVHGAYEGRDFTPFQRLLTQTRVLWFYVGLIGIPRLDAFGLHHDDIVASTSILQPWLTTVAVAGIAVALACALALRRRAPLLSFAVLWFLAGHSLESGIIGLELVYEHRNYLPSIGIIFAAVAGAGYLARHIRHPTILYAGAGIWVAILALLTLLRASQWSNELRLIETDARHHPHSARSQAMLGEYAAVRLGDIGLGIRQLRRAAELAPAEPGFLIRLAALTAASNVRMPESNPLLSSERIGPGNSPGPATQSDLSAAVAKMLATGPVSAYTIKTLLELSDCVRQDRSNCGSLRHEAVTWHTALADNPRARRQWLALTSASLFRLAFEHADYSIALQAAERGLAVSPDSVDLALMRIDALLALGRCDESTEALHLLMANPHASENPDGIATLAAKSRRLCAIKGQAEPIGRSTA